ncbi:carboxypeptidase-like regulatory domain-containing protein [Ulvibacterium marinum]|uniref:carboxypeptidase-like regulatory domain-containing protein n=1 Tax=Ulvibacterium marinum TaxID=2419782 RepID=UPI0024956E94|nr:carboxypeptidase-like regulatory domain-containing protein [Ulvibacterium marinum]
MKHFLPVFLFLLLGHVHSQETIKTIKGTISDGQDPLRDVNITVKDTDRVVSTDASGKYEIDTHEGETLVYSHIGKETLEILVEDVTTFLNVTLRDKIQELDEVVVTKRYHKTQKELYGEYNGNKNLIKTIYGILDISKMPFRAQIIDGDDINLSAVDILTVLRAKIPNVFIPNNTAGRNDIPVFFPRGGSAPVLWEVDGMLMRSAPTFIDIQSIDRMAIIQGLGALVKYGSPAAGGLIVINTKVANFSREPGTNLPYDQAKLRNNFFEKGDAMGSENLAVPMYLQMLHATVDWNEAKESYFQLEKIYGQSPYFYLDARSYFQKEYKDKAMVKMITNNIEANYSNNPIILKALAYQLDEERNYGASLELYKKIFILRPHYQQSYHDLAHAYKHSGKIERAALLYARHQFLLREGLFNKSETFSDILDRDFNNLLVQEGEVLSREKVFFTSDEDDFNGTRLVFEWNDSEAEFELQFVNNDKRYYTFKHTSFDNENHFKDGKQNRFSCQEYLIYDPNGTWQVNVNYLGNKSLTPTYIKATVYYDYGKPYQRHESKVFKLRVKNSNQELFKVQTGDMLTAR